MKNSILTGTLIVAICLCPIGTPGQNAPKTDQPCFIEIIGIVLLVGVYCMNRWGETHWEPSPPLPYPPDLAPDTNAPPIIDIGVHPLVIPSLELGPMMSRDISGNGQTNTYASHAEPWTNQSTFVIQVSTNLSEWRDWTRVTLWKSQTGTLLSMNDGTNVVTAYNPVSLMPPSSPPGNFFRTIAK